MAAERRNSGGRGGVRTGVPRLMLLIAALCAAALLVVPAAHASPRKVPAAFFGTVWDGEATGAPEGAKDAQWGTMARSGVESVRTSFSWAEAQGKAGQAFDFATTDGDVRLAASHGLTLLPVVQYAPRWARAYPSRLTSPPRREADYAAFLTALVGRYGPSGSFWAENPAVPKLPIREWQIWNEPHLRTYWDAPARSRWGSPRGYARLLRAAHRAVKAADPGGRVVLAGLTQKAWDELAKLYRKGHIRRYFEVAALQTFPQTAERALRAARLFRRAMNRAGDRRKPIYVTEITWPASKGKTKGIRFQRQETPAGMAKKLTRAYSLLARNSRRLRLRRVYWYTWASFYGRGGSIFRYAGLQRYSGGVFSPQPALAAYRRSARRFEGCAKDERARCR
jgi:hypothetical protein